jgi:hypothetical protein
VAVAALRDFTDPIDLLTIETLRLFEPNAYQLVRRTIDDLTKVTGKENEENRAAFDEVLSGATEANAVRRALAILFPGAEELLKTAAYSGSRDVNVHRAKRRISVADFAAAYFGLDPQKATWGRSELERILNHADPDTAFQMVEERIGSAGETNRSRLRRLFLDELRTTFEVSREITKDWLCALLNASAVYIAAGDATARSLYLEDNSDRLRLIVIRALEKLGTEHRAALIASVIPEITDLSVLCAVVRSVVGDRRPENALTGRLSAASFGEKTDVLREQLLARVRNMATAEGIWQQAIPRDILLFWWGSTLDDEVWKFTAAAMRDANGLLSLLKLPIHPVYSTAGNYETVAPTWSGILDLDALGACARQMVGGSLSDESKQAAQRFLTAMLNRERH